jgi:threonine dehydrogenase-like Zn-dependent dehydrogenase
VALTYRAVMLTKKGGPEALQVVGLPIEPPGPGEVMVRVQGTGVGSTDLMMLAGTKGRLTDGSADCIENTQCAPSARVAHQECGWKGDDSSSSAR